MLGVDVQTLLAWEKSGELIPDRRSKGGVRYYDIGKVMGLGNEDMPTIGYARVLNHDQKPDLVRQQELLEAFCAAKGWRHEVIADLGSGLNDRKKGLDRLLELILHKRMRRLVLTHQDRLLRFGSELIFALCESQTLRSLSSTRASRRALRRGRYRDHHCAQRPPLWQPRPPDQASSR
jgi:putative resolvase